MDNKPEILAPAGDKSSFLAAIAAGADAIYLGLKHFSARMQAKNFSITELASLVDLAHKKDIKVYIAMNTLVKANDEQSVCNLLQRALKQVKPDAFIVQDLAVINILQQLGYKGDIHFSTLGNLTHPTALLAAKKLGATRVVIPRELSIDEIKILSDACPEGLGLEVFVHGALCYCVSGRCYWSSYFGGKSSLRGRCVQPCRRFYKQGTKKAQAVRAFSCNDLSLDVLTRPLHEVENVVSWKIEGRKKTPHYVFYTVSAYKMLRDFGNDPQKRKTALSYLDQALSRITTHALFLPQRPQMPVQLGTDTASGLFVGIVKSEVAKNVEQNQNKKQGFKKDKEKKFFGVRKWYFNSREDLIAGDLLRIGYEDELGHQLLKIKKRVPKGGRVDIFTPGAQPPRDAKVFLIDRREPELVRILQDLEKELSAEPKDAFVPDKLLTTYKRLPVTKETTWHIHRRLPQGKFQPGTGLWLSRELVEKTPASLMNKVLWNLPPVIWAKEEEHYGRTILQALSKGARRFVLNSPWQASYFEKTQLDSMLAGPFCNIASVQAIATLKDLGFTGVIVSPELAKDDFFALGNGSPLPLGIVIKGFWPLGLSRFMADGFKKDALFQSPKGEGAVVQTHGDTNWLFPSWELDLTEHRKELAQNGYSIFLDMHEYLPRGVASGRKSVFNWNLQLL